MNIDTVHDLYRRVSNIFRARRRRRLNQLFPIEQYPEVLDIGGRHMAWDGSRKVTTINLADDYEKPDIIGDGCNLPLPDGSVSFVYSNSVIEHVAKDRQQRFADEMLRVGKAIYCQTPNHWFPFDVHYQCFFIHWIPGIFRNYFVFRYLTGYGWVWKPTRQQAKEYLDSINLLSAKQLLLMFRGQCVIETEKVLGITKSFVVYRHPAGEHKR